jgi:hypothetical protein
VFCRKFLESSGRAVEDAADYIKLITIPDIYINTAVEKVRVTLVKLLLMQNPGKANR